MKNTIRSAIWYKFLFLISVVLPLLEAPTSAATPTTIFTFTKTWKYFQGGAPASDWKTTAFTETGWSGPSAGLLYVEGNEYVVPKSTSLTLGQTAYYFRTHFTYSGTPSTAVLTFQARVDDGAVFYLNGAEIRRVRMDAGTVSHGTFANALPPGGDASGMDVFTLDAALGQLPGLNNGDNVLAVEVHQRDAGSSDIVFGLELTDSKLERGPYLQIGTPNSVVVRWRTTAANSSRVRYGNAVGNLTSQVTDNGNVNNHELTLTGLSPNTTYFYAVGTTTADLQGDDANHFFVTSPTAGTVKNTRIWVIGDPGTGSANQEAVRNAYETFTASPAKHTDLWLMLGDNAYDQGLDFEHQGAVFHKYAAMLRKSVVWPTLGNHETAQSHNNVDTYEHFNIWTLPQNHEAGGVSSGTEHYYSFDYANIHFVCLDSMTESRSASGDMATWLISDLNANTRDWTIVYFHHPPYTKGSHDSDDSVGDFELVEMRANILPLMESRGIDLVLSGHSHSYERSKLINGHYGLSSTYSDATHAKDSGFGNGGNPYQKPTLGPAANQGTVYITAGSSGKISGGPLTHPAMKVSLNNLGSLVVDVNGNQMTGTFLRENGTQPDTFTIQKKVQNVSITSAVNASEPSTSGSFTITRAGGNTLQALTISFTLTGTATYGSLNDYLVSGAGLVSGNTFTTTIVAGSPTRVVSIVPRPDTIEECVSGEREKVIMTLNATASYSLGSPSVNTLYINEDDNAAPTLTAINNVTVCEDAAPFNVNLSGITDGSACENQTPLVVTATSDNTSVIPNPVVNYTSPQDTGSVTVSPVANANGSATITVTVNDGQSLNNTIQRTFTVTVTAANDVPSFTKGADQTVPESASPSGQSVANWATAISAGPANEVAQTVTFVVTADKPDLFSVQPAVSSSGTLTYTPAANQCGKATVSIYAHDDGGTGTPECPGLRTVRLRHSALRSVPRLV